MIAVDAQFRDAIVWELATVMLGAIVILCLLVLWALRFTRSVCRGGAECAVRQGVQEKTNANIGRLLRRFTIRSHHSEASDRN
jgi:hypothetical protein